MDEGELEEIEVNVGGEVTSDSTGDPIEGANISAFRIDKDELVGESSTGTDGSYSISFTVAEDNTPDELRLEVNAGGFMEKKVTVGFSAEISRNFGLELVTTESTASGKVTRANSDDPIEGATVTGKRVQNNEQLFEVTTDSDGTYESTFKVADEPNEIIITADAEDFDSNDRTVDFGSSIAADFSLNPSELNVTLSGTVKAELDGSTVEGADISVFRPGETESLASTASEPAGTYELSFTVLLDAPSELRIETEDRRFDDASLTVEFSESVTQDIELPSIEISTIEELQSIQTDSDFPLDGFYVQTSEIDASGTSSQNGGAGFEPIGDDTIPFDGSFNGNGFAIEGLTVDRSNEVSVGLFGVVEDGLVRGVTLENINVEGGGGTGGLVGTSDGDIKQSAVDGGVVGNGSGTGGLVGRNSGRIDSSTAAVDVVGRSRVGGLVGKTGGLIDYNGGGEITHSRATGSVDGELGAVGGFVGDIEDGMVSNSEATGDVDGGTDFTGGFAAINNGGEIRRSSASGQVVGTESTDIGGGNTIGGLVARNRNGGVIRNSKATGDVQNVDDGGEPSGGLVGLNVNSEIHSSYATGQVSGDVQVGGLAGVNKDGAEITESYAAGLVEGGEETGGLIGVNGASVSISFWDTEATGQSTGVGRGDSDGSTGLSTSEMQGQSAEESMSSFDFEDTWQTVMGGYPALQWEK